MSKIKRLIFCILYYSFAQYLPSSYIRGCAIFGWIRFWVCRQLFSYCGEGARVEPRAFFNSGRNVSLGKYSSIGERTKIRGSVKIGDHVMMGEEVLIISWNHEFMRTDVPMTAQGFQPEKMVVIGDDVWIGSRAIILSGVTIGNGVIIGAGAVVAKDVPDWAVVVGNPGRVIKLRK
jgi:maltose O-acetyltransferase